MSVSNPLLERIENWLPKSLRALLIRFDNSPITSVEKLLDFVHTRSSYVAQTSLYGYLRTRMGTSYREYFQDEVFSAAIRLAAANLFVTCLSDMTVFCVATAGQERAMTKKEMQSLSAYVFGTAMRKGLEDAETLVDQEQAVADFNKRIKKTDWNVEKEGENAFSLSPEGLVCFAPVVDEFKELDKEIVINSIRFKWRDVRKQARKRLNGQAIGRDWRESKPA
ncbi:MAG: hypothetical protein ACR2OR_12220 [Hyphomicrobiales bacterium]